MRLTRSLLLACWLMVLCVPTLAAEPQHITGTVTALDGAMMTVTTEDGEVLTGALVPGAQTPSVGMQVECDVVEADRLVFVDAVFSGAVEEEG